MTKQSVVVPAPETAAAPPNAVAPLLPYPPPRAAVAASVRRKYLQVAAQQQQQQQQVELSGGAATATGRVGGCWVESMRASSPTHAKAAAALAAGRVDEDRDAWMVKHPSALTKFDQVVAASKGKQIVVFLDYDGTLSPIVDDPDAAYMSDTMRRAVRSVAKHFPTAIVSGRCRDKVFEFVKLAELYYAGSHGMDIKGPARASSRRAKAKEEILILALLSLVWLLLLGETSSLSAGERVPAHDTAGARVSAGKDQVRPRSQGGEQPVLRLRPLPLRRREPLGRAGGHGPLRAAGLPQAEADAGAHGVRGPPHHPVGQGPGPRVPPRVPRLRRLHRRPAALHRRRPHRRGRVPGAAEAWAGCGDPRLKVPQGDQRVLLAAGPRGGDGVPPAARRVGTPHQVPPQVVISNLAHQWRRLYQLLLLLLHYY